MIFSVAVMLLSGIIGGWICKKLKLPGLLGMLIAGVIIGPYVCNLIDDSVLNISSDLRKIALVIILTRAGLSLNIGDLKKVGRPAILMCFLPACFEILGMMLLAPKLLGISLLDAAIMGTVVGAVSPAVIVPKMLKLMEEGYGTKKGIPQLILAGASVDDVFVIVLFSAFTGLAQGQQISAMNFIQIPLSIILGCVIGFVVGLLFGRFFERIHVRDTIKVIVLLCISFLLITAEDYLGNILPFSALIAIMCIGIAMQRKRKDVAARLEVKFNKLWVVAEVILFVLVGASVDISYAAAGGVNVVSLILGVLLIRMIGVFCCLLKTNLTQKERMFCMIGYMPKATVQAAIGGIPLAMGLACGNIVLTVAVMSILISAPLGAFMIDLTYKRLLTRS